MKMSLQRYFPALLTVVQIVAAGALSPTQQELDALDQVADAIPGARLLWTRDGAIWHAQLRPWVTQRITGSGTVEGRPRWSPDGAHILFQRQHGNTWDIFVMDNDFSNERLLLTGAHSADWADSGKSFTAIQHDLSVVSHTAGYRVLRYTMATGATEILYDATEPPYNGWPLSEAAELHPSGRYLLTFTADDGDNDRHHTFVVDLVARTYSYNDENWRGDCSPGWSPDGTFFTTTARTSNRPVMKTAFDFSTGEISASELLADAGTTSDRYYIHGHRVSNDGQWLIAGLRWNSGVLSGNREIYLWKLDNNRGPVARISFDTGEDMDPSFHEFLKEDQQPVMALSPTTLSFSVAQGGERADDAIIHLANTGTGTLDSAEIAEDADWLTVTLQSRNETMELSNSVVADGLSAGTYTQTVSVSVPNAANSPLTYVVELHVVAMKPAETLGKVIPGLWANYYELAPSSVMPDFQALSPCSTTWINRIDFPASLGVFANSGRTDTVAAIFSGFLTVPESGVYTFYVKADDQSVLYIGDIKVVDSGSASSMQAVSGQIGLESGAHAIRVAYFEGVALAGLGVEFEGPVTPRQVIPDNAFSRTPSLVPTFAILEPQVGDVWRAGDSAYIQWTGENVDDAAVTIEYLVPGSDSIASFMFRESFQFGGPKWGRLAFVVPNAFVSTQCRVMVQEYFGGAEAQSGVFSIVAPGAVKKPADLQQIGAFTNLNLLPTGDIFISVKGKADDAIFAIHDTRGRMIYSMNLHDRQSHVYRPSGLARGIYLASLNTKEKRMALKFTVDK